MSGCTDEAIERHGVLDAELLRKPFDWNTLTERLGEALDQLPTDRISRARRSTSAEIVEEASNRAPEIRQAVGLVDELRPRAQRLERLDLRAVAGREQDRQVGSVGAERARELEPRLDRHHEIGEEEVDGRVVITLGGVVPEPSKGRGAAFAACTILALLSRSATCQY